MARRRSPFTVINEGSSAQYLTLQLALSASLPVADRLSYYAINFTKNETVKMCSAGRSLCCFKAPLRTEEDNIPVRSKGKRSASCHSGRWDLRSVKGNGIRGSYVNGRDVF